MNWILIIAGITGFRAAYAFWHARNCVQDGWSSKLIFKFCMNLVYAWAAHLILVLGLAIYFLAHDQRTLGIAGLIYFAFPFILGAFAQNYRDRLWSITVLVGVTTLGSTACLYLL